ncbi:uncharacterized protein LOC113793017 isoform X2 [Dermatophagoides pteronyssinus]|uniref:uncharacterized protein LOC113793017 isoform X2 n=1 Tax=Dermatophagoides pteronyssinus TaxID=6956 RepID=UPI003F668ADC
MDTFKKTMDFLLENMRKEIEEKSEEKITELKQINRNLSQIPLDFQKVIQNQETIINRVELMEKKFENQIQDMTNLIQEKFMNHHHQNESVDISSNNFVKSQDKTIQNDRIEKFFENSWLNQSQRKELIPSIRKHESQFKKNPTTEIKRVELIVDDDDDDNDNNMEVSTANSDEIFKSSQLDSLSHLPSVSNDSTVKRRSEDSISRENDAGKSRRFKENDGNIGSVNLQSNEHSGIIAATQSNYVAKTENSGLKIFDSNNVIQSRLNKQSTSKPRIILPSQDRLIPLKDKIDEIPENFMLPSRKSRSKLEDFSQLYSSLDISYDDL